MTLRWSTLFGQRDVRETATSTSGTFYLNIGPPGFRSVQPDVDNVNINHTAATVSAGSALFAASVQLPQGATMTAVVVYGSAAESWTLHRVNSVGSAETLATAQIGVEDTSISTPIIDNQTYSYNILTGSLDQADTDDIHGARITYTI